MKKINLIVTLFFAISTNFFSQNLKIGDFEMPVTKAEKFYIGGNFNLNSNDTVSKFHGDFRLDYSKFYSSLPYSYYLSAFIDADINEYIIRNDNQYYSNGARNQNISPNIYFNYNKYFSEENKIYFNANTSTNLFYNIIDNNQYLNGNYELGIGYGRTIDATSLAKALRIQEFLINQNQLNGEMDKEIVMEVAQHCDKLRQYEIEYGEKFQEVWFLDLEKIIKKSGKLSTGNLNPFSVLRVLEVLYAETIWYRPIGWNIGSNFVYRTNKYFEGQTTGSDFYGTSIQFNVGYPINNNLHFNHSTSFRYLREFDSGVDNNIIQSQTSLTYNITNLFHCRLSYYLFSSSEDTYINKNHNFELYADYYLENNVSIVLSYKFINYIADNSSYKYNRNNNTVNIGFNYRFW